MHTINKSTFLFVSRSLIIQDMTNSWIFIPLQPISKWRKHNVLGSVRLCHTAVRPVPSLRYFAWHDIFLVSAGISMKLATNIRYVSVKWGQRSRSLSSAHGNLVNSRARTNDTSWTKTNTTTYYTWKTNKLGFKVHGSNVEVRQRRT